MHILHTHIDYSYAEHLAGRIDGVLSELSSLDPMVMNLLDENRVSVSVLHHCHPSHPCNHQVFLRSLSGGPSPSIDPPLQDLEEGPTRTLIPGTEMPWGAGLPFDNSAYNGHTESPIRSLVQSPNEFRCDSATECTSNPSTTRTGQSAVTDCQRTDPTTVDCTSLDDMLDLDHWCQEGPSVGNCWNMREALGGPYDSRLSVTNGQPSPNDLYVPAQPALVSSHPSVTPSLDGHTSGGDQQFSKGGGTDGGHDSRTGPSVPVSDIGNIATRTPSTDSRAVQNPSQNTTEIDEIVTEKRRLADAERKRKQRQNKRDGTTKPAGRPKKSRGNVEAEVPETAVLDLCQAPVYVGAQCTLLLLTENHVGKAEFISGMKALRGYLSGKDEEVPYKDFSEMSVRDVFVFVEKGKERMTVLRFQIYQALTVLPLRALEYVPATIIDYYC